jgi:hypothetical protein
MRGECIEGGLWGVEKGEWWGSVKGKGNKRE